MIKVLEDILLLLEFDIHPIHFLLQVKKLHQHTLKSFNLRRKQQDKTDVTIIFHTFLAEPQWTSSFWIEGAPI